MTVLLGLAILVFSAWLFSIFFQLSRIEQNLDSLVEQVEIYLLQEYGEARHKDHITEDQLKLEDDDDE